MRLRAFSQLLSQCRKSCLVHTMYAQVCYLLPYAWAAVCCRPEIDCECLWWLMLTLSMDKVEHSVFMQVDEETVSATFCGWLPARLFWPQSKASLWTESRKWCLDEQWLIVLLLLDIVDALGFSLAALWLWAMLVFWLVTFMGTATQWWGVWQLWHIGSRWGWVYIRVDWQAERWGQARLLVDVHMML